MNNLARTSAFSTVSTTSGSRDNVVQAVFNNTRVTEPNHDWHTASKQRLNHLCRLERGWDGYRGIPVTFENAHFALGMLSVICRPSTPTPDIIPGNRGDLQVEWHMNGTSIELDVRGPNKVIAWRENPTTGPDGEEIALTNNFAVVAEWVKQMLEPAVADQRAAV